MTPHSHVLLIVCRGLSRRAFDLAKASGLGFASLLRDGVDYPRTFAASGAGVRALDALTRNHDPASSGFDVRQLSSVSEIDLSAEGHSYTVVVDERVRLAAASAVERDLGDEEAARECAAAILELDADLDRAIARNSLDDVIVCVTADHGAGFDRDLNRRGFAGRLHADVAHVPLVVRWPDRILPRHARRAEDRSIHSTHDIVPTLLAAATSGPLPVGSILGCADGSPRRTIVIEECEQIALPPSDLYPLGTSYRGAGLVNRTSIDWPHQRIEYVAGAESWEELYDLEWDPYERMNLSRRGHGPAARPNGEFTPPLTATAAPVPSREERTRASIASYPALVTQGAGVRRLPAVEHVVAWADIPNAEPITFIVAASSPLQLRLHLGASACFHHDRHEWIIVENIGNRAYQSISSLYVDAGRRARNDLRFYIHQDVVFPPDWETRFFGALAALETRDPNWGVLGAVGRVPTPPNLGEKEKPAMVGHWSDAFLGEPRRSQLPAEVQSLDEMALGFRASRGFDFDPNLPGFHCYGTDLCLTARARGHRCYAIDAPLVHELWRHDGVLIETPEISGKREQRLSPAFRAQFLPSMDYVGAKWSHMRPFHSTSVSWR